MHYIWNAGWAALCSPDELRLDIDVLVKLSLMPRSCGCIHFQRLCNILPSTFTHLYADRHRLSKPIFFLKRNVKEILQCRAVEDAVCL